VTSGLLQTVRTTCARVAATSDLVHINIATIPSFASLIPVTEARAAAEADRLETTNPGPDSWDIERRAALTLAGVAVNFTSGWHDIMPKRPGQSGATSTVTRLRDYESATGILTPERLMQFNTTDASQVFETPMDGGALETLLELLAATLNELGEMAAAHGSFVKMINAASGSAERLATLLSELPSFNDIASHRGEPVAFHKRSQLAAASIQREFSGAEPGAFTDMGKLTIFADNLVPHVLRIDGVLSYSPDLLDRIDAASLLTHGAPDEVEIRACGVHATELIIEHLRAIGTPMNAADLDHWLWTRGAAANYKTEPRHRCRNPYY